MTRSWAPGKAGSVALYYVFDSPWVREYCQRGPIVPVSRGVSPDSFYLHGTGSCVEVGTFADNLGNGTGTFGDPGTAASEPEVLRVRLVETEFRRRATCGG